MQGSKFVKLGAAVLLLGAGAGTAGVANGFTDYHAAAADQYGTTTVAVTATATVSTPAAGNLGQNGAGTPAGQGSRGSNGGGHSSGNAGVAGNKGNGGQAGVATGVAGNSLPFTGLNLVTLVIVALILAALGLGLRAFQRGSRGYRARSRA